MKLLSFLIVFVGLSLGAFAQATYEVTTSDLVGETSLPVMLPLAVADAEAGLDVIIYLNVPDDGVDGKELILIDATLLINNGNLIGSLLITPHPSTNVIQGLDGTLIPDVGQAGLEIDKAVNVTIDGLNFENFIYPANGSAQRAIHIDHSDNIIVRSNNFIHNGAGVDIYESTATVVENDFLDHLRDAVSYADDATLNYTSWTFPEINIENNVMNYSPAFLAYLIGDVDDVSDDIAANLDGIYFHFKNPNHELSVMIRGNIITEGKQGIQMRNDLAIGLMVDFSILGNTLMDAQQGITLTGPRNHWKVEGNSISGMGYGIVVGDGYFDPVINDHGMDFVNPNSLGYPLKNINNVILDCKVSFNTRLRKTNLIIGYEVQGRIIGVDAFPVIIRETFIEHALPTPINLPIDIYDPTESSLSGIFSLTLANYDESTLIVDMDVIGTSADNANFILDFYEANENGDLLSYLGNEIHSEDTDPGYEAVLSGIFLSEGTRIGVSITALGDVGGIPLGTSEVKYIGIEPQSCDTCNSFKPHVGETYWVSAWVQVDEPLQVLTYEDGSSGPTLELGFYGSGFDPSVFYPTGEIIDGWQRIVGKFQVPTGTNDLLVSLKGDLDYETYFDDIRIHPFNGSMKSYVYDGETFWLTSELDDNNYATFYEYDQQGGLVRIKKETSRGIVTVQETGSGTLKDE